MTTQSVIITTYSYGATPLSATLRNADTDALIATADTVTETSSGSGIYVAAFGEVSVITAGVYRIRAVASGSPINRYVTLTGVNLEVATSRSDRDAAGGGGGAGDASQTTLLAVQTTVETLASGIAGRAVDWAGNVGPGGVLELTLGDDHETVNGNNLPIRVHDVGGTLHARLVAVGVTLQWSAGQNLTGGMIAGTVAGVTHAAGVTTIVIHVPDCAATGNVLAPYVWQLQRTVGLRRARELQGTLRLRPDMF